MSTHPIVGVALRVSSLQKTLPFYTEIVGLEPAENSDRPEAEVGLTAPGGSDVLVHLIESPDAPRAPEAAGLFHLAVRYPDRESLSQALRRMRTAGYRLTGASDHKVSEALYIDDPAGNSVELYRDRPKDEWVWDDKQQVHMSTDPLDLGDLMGASHSSSAAAPTETVMGHVHLEVTDVEKAREFYGSRFGMNLTSQRPSARFMSWGGYHHHLGLNSWRRRSDARPADALGLARVTARVERERFDQLREGADARADAEVELSDPDGIVWRILRAD